MAAKRRPSMRTRMKVEDVSSWVEHNQQPIAYSPHEEAPRVRFNVSKQPSKDSDTESLVSNCDPVYHDGGYGWIVVLYSFLMHAILDGSSFCFGIIFLAIQKKFDVGRIGATFVASGFLSLPLFLSPLAGIITDVFHCRASMLFGTVITVISCLLAMCCTNIALFTLFLGVGCGFGMSFMYNGAIVSVTYYFDSKRGKATACAVAGTGIGTVVFPFYMNFVVDLCKDYLDEVNSYILCFLIGYIIIGILAYMYKDVAWMSDTPKYKIRKFEKRSREFNEERQTNLKKRDGLLRHAISLPNLNILKIDPGSITSLCEVGTDGKIEMPARSKSVALFENQLPSMPTIPEYSMLNTRLNNLEHLDLELANSPCNTVKATRRRIISKTSMSVDQINEMEDEDFKINIILTSTESSESDESSSDDSEMSNDGDSSSSELSEKVDPNVKLLDKNLNPIVFNRSASSAPNSARITRNSLAQGTSNYAGGRVMAKNAIQGRFVSNLLRMGKIPSAPMLMTPNKQKSWFYHPKLEEIRRLFNEERSRYWTVFQNKIFVWMTVSVFFLYIFLDVPYVYFYDFATENLNSTETFASGIYSSMGVVNFLSLFVYGQIADKARHLVGPTSTVAMVMVGVSMFLACFAYNQWILIGCAVFFGCFVTANYGMQNVFVGISVNDMADFQAAFSLLSMVEGIASFIGPTVIFSVLREETGDYQLCFLIAGISALFSAFGMYMAHREIKKRDAEEELEEEKLRENMLEGNNIRQNENGANHEIQGLLLA